MIKYICGKEKKKCFIEIFLNIWKANRNQMIFIIDTENTEKKTKIQFEAQAAGEYLYNEAAAILEKEIQKALNKK